MILSFIGRHPLKTERMPPNAGLKYSKIPIFHHTTGYARAQPIFFDLALTTNIEIYT
jgi:hypothetical protein